MEGKKSDCLVLLSGGMDSFACAQYYLEKNHTVKALFVDYGQQAAKLEYLSAKKIAIHLGIELDIISINLKQEFSIGEVMGRNLFLLSLALTSGQIKKGLLVIGIHKSTDYYDCRTHFFKQIKNIIIEMSGGHINLLAPFLEWSKEQIIQFINQYNLPISLTYSCETGELNPCGECLSCKDRILLECQ